MSLKIPLTDLVIGEPEIEAVIEVLRSRWLTSGARTAEFEQRFAAKLGCEKAYAVSSCTAALHLTYAALRLGPGDEVICPDLTFVATANAVRYTGARPMFAGPVSEHDLTISPEQVEALMSPRTRAICVMHYAGYACDMDAILEIAARQQLPVVEDCAHSPFAWHMGADGSGRALGTIGQFGCFSFFGTKNMSTGEGGMVCTSDPDLGGEIDRLRTHGITVPTFERHRRPTFGYEVAGLGFNYRFDDIRAAIGLCQLDRVDELNAQRRRLVAAYREALQDVPGVVVPFRDRNLEHSSCHLMPVLVDGDVLRIRAQLRECGIQTSKHYDPVSSLALYRTERPAPSAAIAARLVTLPLGPHMGIGDVHEVTAALQAAMGTANARTRIVA